MVNSLTSRLIGMSLILAMENHCVAQLCYWCLKVGSELRRPDAPTGHYQVSTYVQEIPMRQKRLPVRQPFVSPEAPLTTKKKRQFHWHRNRKIRAVSKAKKYKPLQLLLIQSINVNLWLTFKFVQQKEQKIIHPPTKKDSRIWGIRQQKLSKISSGCF